MNVERAKECGRVNSTYGRHALTFLSRLWRPMTWPRWVRRAFVLLLPLALPIWILLNLASVFNDALRAMIGPLATFWNGRQRYYHRYGENYHYYNRHRERSSSREDVS